MQYLHIHDLKPILYSGQQWYGHIPFKKKLTFLVTQVTTIIVQHLPLLVDTNWPIAFGSSMLYLVPP